jgi:GNAT superfamily N-acetyltransferase
MLFDFVPKRLPQISAKPLSRGNVDAALEVADRCFPNPEDQVFLRGHWVRVVERSVTYFCPDDQEQLTLLDHFVYNLDGAVVAFGGLYRHDSQPGREWLNWFGVDPSHRGHGYGRKVVEHLAEIALRRGTSTLVGYTDDSEENTDTQRFYMSLHFQPTVVYSFRGERVRLYERPLKEDI